MCMFPIQFNCLHQLRKRLLKSLILKINPMQFLQFFRQGSRINFPMQNTDKTLILGNRIIYFIFTIFRFHRIWRQYKQKVIRTTNALKNLILKINAAANTFLIKPSGFPRFLQGHIQLTGKITIFTRIRNKHFGTELTFRRFTRRY